jgi:hypothetical protein
MTIAALEDINAPATDAAEHSIAIEFQLVQPLIAGWRFFYQGVVAA